MGTFNFEDHAHRRLNILTGEWVLVSPHRTKRPWQGKLEKPAVNERPEYDENCYLCPGNVRANGERNPEYDSTYVFNNDFAALVDDVPEGKYNENNLLQAESERGICRVVNFSPNHKLTLAEMEVDAIAKVVDLWADQYKELGAIDYINHVQIFENKGDIMGNSNPHPHGQIWAQSTVPMEVQKKTERQTNYFKDYGTGMLEEYVKLELSKGERILAENATFVALVPFWAVWPYEVMILPKRRVQNVAQLSEEERADFAALIKLVTVKYDNLFEVSFPYSAGIHQAPTDGDHPEWHMHFSFYPPLLRSATIKKFMVGYEMFANPQRDITAEGAASTLRDLPEIHFKESV